MPLPPRVIRARLTEGLNQSVEAIVGQRSKHFNVLNDCLARIGGQPDQGRYRDETIRFGGGIVEVVRRNSIIGVDRRHRQHKDLSLIHI